MTSHEARLRTKAEHAADPTWQKFYTDSADTIARIDARVGEEDALRAERYVALAWCRANGNPHLEPKP